jgi:hypothetical protein
MQCVDGCFKSFRILLSLTILEIHFRIKFVNEITNDDREEKTGESYSTNEGENKIC